MNKIIFLFFLFFLQQRVQGYESYSRLGYSNCMACHHSPAGGMLLTDYGKIISASTSLWSAEYKEGNIKKAINLNGKLDHAFLARIANLQSDSADELFPMQGDYLTAFKAKKFKILSQLAKAPSRKNNSDSVEEPSTVDEFYFREFKFMTQVKNHVFTIGREKRVFGLNLVDHTLYNKSQNRLNVTDLANVLRYDFLAKSYSIKGLVFLPSYQENREDREYGTQLGIKIAPLPFLHFGLSGLYGKSDSIRRELLGVNLKLFSKFILFMYENHFAHRTIIENSKEFTQWSHFAKLSVFPKNYLEFFINAENFVREKHFESEIERLGAGVNIRLIRNLALQVDAKRTYLNSFQEDLYITQLFLNWW